MFDLRPESDRESDTLRYRRVTHVNDPIPLLPLEEWGYVMHAGEIYISKLHLPPSVADLEFCDGDADERCIAGSARSEILSSLTRRGRTRPPDGDASHRQIPLLNKQSDQVDAQWSLVPARYRLWELFFAHRDYFWRIGLCVPGGDPGPWRLSTKETETFPVIIDSIDNH
jgi:triacylglycerol lipase